MDRTITSPTNEKVRFLRSLHDHAARQRARRFLIEGIRLVEDALEGGAELDTVLVDEGNLTRNERGRRLLERLDRLGYWRASPRALQATSGTVTPQGVVAAVRLPESTPPADPGTMALVVDGVKDPGNLGTILRTAEAAGVSTVWLSPGTVDAFGPKVVRAGMGVHFRLPLFSGDWATIERQLRGKQVWAADARAARPYYEADWRLPSALIIGGEAHGLSEDGIRVADGLVSIPMAGATESLNSAIAAAVILFEAVRQRRTECLPNRP